MSKKGLYWICQVGGWLFFVLFNSLLLKLQNSFDTRAAQNLFILLVLGVVLSHQYRNLIVRYGWVKKSSWVVLPRVIIAPLIFAAILELLQYLIERLLGIADTELYNTGSIIYNIFLVSFLFFLWSVIYFLFHYIENYKRAEIENLKWEASINEIELNKLKSQLNPHFMFNAMNSIRALVDEDPLKSKDAITRLSNILRNTLQMGKNKVIAFDEEMKIVSDYLELEAIRYEERLKTDIQIDPQSREFLVPPLMLQTLVENGIKHGISRLTKGGKLSIKTQVSDGKLQINIRNSGQLVDRKGEESGFGVKNTVQRLQLLYGKDASFSLGNEDADTVLTTLIIPKQNIPDT